MQYMLVYNLNLFQRGKSMLEKIIKIKDQFAIRRSYLGAATNHIIDYKEAKLLDHRIEELNELIQYIKFYDKIPKTYEEFLKSDLKDQILQEIQSDYLKQKKEALNGIVNEAEIDQLFSENVVLYRKIDQLIKNFENPIHSSFYEDVLSYLCQNYAIIPTVARSILFLDVFEEYFPLIMNEEEQIFCQEIKTFIRNSKVQSSKKLATLIYQKLKCNPKILSVLKSPNLFFDQIFLSFIKKYGSPKIKEDFCSKEWMTTHSISEKLEYYRMFEEEKIKKVRKTANNYKNQYDSEMRQWTFENLPHKYVELKNTVKIYIYTKMSQLMKEEYSESDLLSSGVELKNSLFQIYHYLTQHRNFDSMDFFLQFLTNLIEKNCNLSSEIEIEFPNQKEEPKSSKKQNNPVIRFFTKLKSYFVSKIENKKGFLLKHTPQFDDENEKKRLLHKDYLYGLGIEMITSIQNQFQSLCYSSKWKEEMVQKFPILNKNTDDLTIPDLQELFNFATSFLEEVKQERTKSYHQCHILEKPKLPKNNLFLSLFQNYSNIDLNEFQKANPEDIKNLLKMLRGMLKNYSNQESDLKSLKCFMPEMKEQLIETYFEAMQYVSFGKSRS